MVLLKNSFTWALVGIFVVPIASLVVKDATVVSWAYHALPLFVSVIGGIASGILMRRDGNRVSWKSNVVAVIVWIILYAAAPYLVLFGKDRSNMAFIAASAFALFQLFRGVEYGLFFAFTRSLMIGRLRDRSSINSVGLGVIFVYCGFKFLPLFIKPEHSYEEIIRQDRINKPFLVNGFYGPAHSVTPDFHGKLIITGSFTKYHGNDVNGIVRLNADGSLDRTFSVDLRNELKLDPAYVFILPSNRIFVAAHPFRREETVKKSDALLLAESGLVLSRFVEHPIVRSAGQDQEKYGLLLLRKYDGASTLATIKLNSSSVVCYSSSSPSHSSIEITQEFNGLTLRPNAEKNILCIAEESSQALNEGGYLLKVRESGPTYSQAVARYNKNGDKELTLLSGSEIDVGTFLYLPNQSMFFSNRSQNDKTFSFDEHLYLLKNGTIDKTFKMERFESIRGIRQQPDGKIILYGDPFQPGEAIGLRPTGKGRGIARLNADGSLDRAFSKNLGEGFDQAVVGIYLSPDGKIIVVGAFTVFKGTNGKKVGSIARLNSDGSLDSTFGTITSGNTTNH